MPASLAAVVTQLMAFISYNLGMAVPAVSLEKNHFGSVLLTNITSFGITEVYAPLCSLTRNFMCVTACSPEERAVVENGVVVIRKKMNLMVTADHRYLDGAAAPKLKKAVDAVWSDPSKFD